MAHKARGSYALIAGVAIECCTRVNTYGKGRKFAKLFRALLLEVVAELVDYYWISVDICVPQKSSYCLIPAARDRLPTDEEVIDRFNTRFAGTHPKLVPGDLRLPRVRADMVSLSSFMRDVNSFVARRCNARLGFRGRLWRDRYQHIVLTSVQQLLQSALEAELTLVHEREVDRPQDSPYGTLTRWLITPTPDTTPDLYRLVCLRRGVSTTEYPMEAFCAELCALLDERFPGWREPADVPRDESYIAPTGFVPLCATGPPGSALR